ncbi:PKD domain-containing protein [Chryseobacterium sp.]|uniref:PKD domain-containing protein n=1 Tax=Chryseobacterium sp. TaxID=1871047 RepID=UPI00289A98B7|nr:PKD domain-containing protein [Chryseobacterium sp.]
MMKKLLCLFLFITIPYCAQINKNVFFIGNSYTAQNNLPQLISEIAGSTGDHLNYQSYTPGGSTLQDHANNNAVLNTINQGNWDYVVLQEQSQIPAFSTSFVQTEFFPFATQLANNIKSRNACGNPIFYMTWGRKNGDTPNCTAISYLCTYEGMDDKIYERYMQAALETESLVSPVGRVWRYIRTQHPTLELYEADGSHPNYLGSMIAAYTFYTTIFKKDPTLSTYDGNLLQTEANIVRNAVKTIVFDHMDTWYINLHDTNSRFDYQLLNSNTVQFNNQSGNATMFQWDFGDGSTSNMENPSHTYGNTGDYNVKLTTDACGRLTTKTEKISITTLATLETQKSVLKIYPNPVKDILVIKTFKKISNLEIKDASGRKMSCKILSTGDEYKVFVQNLSPGNYIITYQDDDRLSSEKFIKE